MEVRIGTTVDGRPAGFDTASPRPLLLVGDPGRGKTTVSRYLTRWWLTDSFRHAHVFTQTPSEWADLRCDLQNPDSLVQPVGAGCRPDTCLAVVDDLDLTSDVHLPLPRLWSSSAVLTSHGGSSLTDRSLLVSDVACFGLVHAEPANVVEAAVLEGQRRMDWPMGTVAVVPDRRGPVDFPCHRWHTPMHDWAAVQ